MSQRLKGQETTLSFTDPDGLVENLGDIKSFEAELDIQILEEGYIGDTANRFDEIYNGSGGNAEMHLENSKWFSFTNKVQERATRRSPAGGKFAITSSFAFADGTRVRVTFEDVFFGPFPLKVGGRAEYVSATVTWKCSEITRVL
jgi:hypothetical protein